jgi:4'-phosphopantetheinyl transferase
MQQLPLPDCVPAGSAVWQLALDLQAPPAAEDVQLLSDDERSRIARLRRPADRMRSIAGRAALRRLLGHAVSVAPQRLRFGAGAHGKPQLLSHEGPAFNVAHSGRYVLVALGGGTIGALGVDVEQRDGSMDATALAPHALTLEERLALAASRHDTTIFYDYWSAKEAALKALGVGVSEHLQQVTVLRQPGRRLQLRHQMAHWPPLQACLLPAPFQYSAALAWHTKD